MVLGCFDIKYNDTWSYIFHSKRIMYFLVLETRVFRNNNCILNMFQIPQVIGLTYQKFLHLTAQHDCISPVEYKLSALQLHSQAMDGIHGMEVELATCLGAVMAQVCFVM